MKRPPLICLLLLFFACQTLAQDTATGIFHLKEIQANGVVLDKGWTFKAGDDPAWAKPDYDDHDWVPMDPTKELHHLPEVRKAEIGWFRLKLDIDSSQFGKTFAFIVSTLGATEIYLNGQLVYRFGIVSKNYKEEQTRYYTNHLLSLRVANQASQVIAVRHSFNKKNLYLKFTNERPVAKLVLKEINEAFAYHIKDDSFDSTLRSVQVSYYLPLGFLLLFLFFSFRLRKEYLYSGIFCFSLFGAILMHIFALSEPTTVSRSNYLLLATQVFYITGALSFINSIYILYKRKRGFFYYIIVLYGIWSLPFFFVSYDASGLFNACFFPVINLEFLRLNFLAVRKGRKGAWILFITSLLFTLSIGLYIWFSILGKTESSALLQGISFMIPGIGLSLFYAGEFARTALDLQQRATEVEELSQEMIAKEREKQQILGAQNITLEKQVAERTAELSQSLRDLKDMQEQLIQREKMASLGELTAGIAHEIQNPLNFVNNFSELNSELIEEMQEEINLGNTEKAAAIAADIKQNFEKIAHHGKRADSIVKGMLQHSRNSSGHKEPTDINTLVEECLRLSYHGMRAKDKSFNVKTETGFESHLPKINVVSQEIGRVVLNLFTNAFYSVLQKRRQLGDTYEPEVAVKTGKADGKLTISIRDNGMGVSKKVLDKIFQPFFTTKPSGQGTGLGLSMSYDIITAHGGELKADTKEGEFAEFTIFLPLNMDDESISR